MNETFRRLLCLVVVVVLTNSVDSLAASETRQWRVRFDGYGPVRMGMTAKEASKLLGITLDGGDSSSDCYYVSSDSLDGIHFMVTNGTIARIDVTSEKILLESGARIGNATAEIMKLYPGRTKIDPHLYTGPEGKYLTVKSKNRIYGIRFETDPVTKRVERYYAGKFPEILYSEGCS